MPIKPMPTKSMPAESVRPLSPLPPLPPRAGIELDANSLADLQNPTPSALAKNPMPSWFALPVQLAMRAGDNLAKQKAGVSHIDSAYVDVSPIGLPAKPLIFNRLEALSRQFQNPQDEIAHRNQLRAAIATLRPSLLLVQLAAPMVRDNYNKPDKPPALPPFATDAQAFDLLSARIKTQSKQFGVPLALSTPLVGQGQLDEVAGFLTRLALATGCKLSINLNHLHMSCQYSGAPPRPFIDALKPETIALIEIGGGCDAVYHEVCHEVWVLYTHLLERIGSRPTLIGNHINGHIDGARLSLLLADMVRADDRINAARNIGPQLGASCVIFK